MSTMTDERVITETLTSTDKPESAHIVMTPPGEPDETPHAYVMRARIEGFPVTAICGFTWIPNKPATGLPVCQECNDIYESEDRGDDSGDGLPDE